MLQDRGLCQAKKTLNFLRASEAGFTRCKRTHNRYRSILAILKHHTGTASQRDWSCAVMALVVRDQDAPCPVRHEVAPAKPAPVKRSFKIEHDAAKRKQLVDECMREQTQAAFRLYRATGCQTLIITVNIDPEIGTAGRCDGCSLSHTPGLR